MPTECSLVPLGFLQVRDPCIVSEALAGIRSLAVAAERDASAKVQVNLRPLGKDIARRRRPADPRHCRLPHMPDPLGDRTLLHKLVDLAFAEAAYCSLGLLEARVSDQGEDERLASCRTVAPCHTMSQHRASTHEGLPNHGPSLPALLIT